MSSFQPVVRDLLSRCVAAVLLLFLAPTLAGIALAVWIGNGRPVLFRQQRLGLRGAVFTIYKFRTMVPLQAGARVTAANDSRITFIGRLLRRFKLDELPQLWNILRGEMTFVGPRPEMPAFVEAQDPRWQQVLSVKPGLTELATILYRNEEELLSQAACPEELYQDVIKPAKLKLSLEYLKRRSFFFDCQVILYTVVFGIIPSAFDRTRIERAFGLEKTV